MTIFPKHFCIVSVLVCFFRCCIEFNKWIIQLNISYIFRFDRPKDQHDFVLLCVHVVHILCAIWNMIKKKKKQFDYHDLARDRWKISSFHRNISIRQLTTCNLTTHTTRIRFALCIPTLLNRTAIQKKTKVYRKICMDLMVCCCCRSGKISILSAANQISRENCDMVIQSHTKKRTKIKETIQNGLFQINNTNKNKKVITW